MGASVAHGALDHAALAALGLRADDLLDFSSNLNPFGPPPGVRSALAALDPAPYPDRSGYALRHALATVHGCDPDAILLGNGANELIHLLARALLRPADPVLVLGPTYGEYAYASALAGAQVVSVSADPAGGFALDLSTVLATVDRLRPRLTWLCVPNNPTGYMLPLAAQATLRKACAASGGLLVLDHAYHAMQRMGSLSEAHKPPTPGLIGLHSLTKSYAIAGLRLGYMVADPAHVTAVAAYQPTWSVSSAAQAAGLAALADHEFLARTIPQLWLASDALHAAIETLGLPVWRAALPFMLVETGAGAATRAALLARGCVVRDCTSFGLPRWVRVAPQRPAANQRLIAAWKDVP